MCFAASTLQKSKANKFLEVFDDDRGKYCFESSCIIALFLAKEVLFMF